MLSSSLPLSQFARRAATGLVAGLVAISLTACTSVRLPGFGKRAKLSAAEKTDTAGNPDEIDIRRYLGPDYCPELQVREGTEMLRRYERGKEGEPGAIVCRVARSFTRFGSFEIFTSHRDIDTLRRLVDYTIRTDFPHLGEPSADVYASWFAEVCRLTAEMIVHWIRVGFVHGVMNTDNMSVLGLTIDYGPYGWLDDYDTGWTPNTTDADGRRYRFGRQPSIALWNLARFAEALHPLVEDETALIASLDTFGDTYNALQEKTWA